MSRISAAFDRMRDERRVGLVTYVTAGDPSLVGRAATLLRSGRAQGIGPVLGDDIVAQFAFTNGVEATFISRGNYRD